MIWHNFYKPINMGKLVALCLLAVAPCTGEEHFSFEQAESNFRFAEIVIKQGLPEGVDEADLQSGSKEESKFLWFQYGDASSRAVCLRFNPQQPSILFVDANRSQKFTDEESFESDSEGIWFVDLCGEFGSQQDQTEKQRVRIRHDKTAATWHLATAGTRTGKADYGGELRDARIEDKNANGLWFDPADRLLVDFDGNGKLSRLREQIPAQGMRNIRGKVWAIAGSPTGNTVSLSQVTGSGFIIPTLDLADTSAKVTSVTGQLGSRSGIGIPISSVDQPIEVPVGDWYVENISFEVTGKDGAFLFGFTRSGNGKPVTIADEEKKELNLLGELTLSATVSVQNSNDKTDLILTPSLRTENGCYLIASRTGTASPINENRLQCFSSAGGRELEVGSSGFS